MDRIRVLIADDHALFRQGLRHLLELEEDLLVVGEASNGQETEEKAQELSPDVVLMDIAMPGEDGVAVTRSITQHHPEIKVLILTMYEEREQVFQALRAGARGYLLKTSDAEEVARAIRTIYHRQDFLSPPITTLLIEDWRHSKSSAPTKVPLSATEREILFLLAKGMSNQEISQRLFLSEKTVRNRLSTIFRKLKVRNRTEAVLSALALRMVNLDNPLT